MRWFIGCVVLFPVAVLAADKVPLPGLPPEQKQELVQYLQTHWASPEQYVVSKFADHDIVLLGEYHRIKHDAELVQHLVPLLYQAGVYNLGLEFTTSDSQADIDSLLAAPAYDEARVRRLFSGIRGEYSLWPYLEYMDIFRRAWELNRSLPPEAPRFRIVSLMYAPDFTKLTEGTISTASQEVLEAVWNRGSGDDYMANVILTEFVAKGQKALIYSGFAHALTRFRQPAVDVAAGTVYGPTGKRMGHKVYDKIGERAFLIYLHQPWPTKAGYDKPHSYPAAGAIDAVMREFSDTRVGFDLAGTPFGAIRDANTYWAYGNDDFSVADFADGWIYQKWIGKYEGATVDYNVVTWDNLAAVLANFANPAVRKPNMTPATLMQGLAQDADIPRRFQHLY